MNRTVRAFTLLELLLVVGIIGLIVALLLSAVSRSKEKAKRAKCESQLHQFYILAILYAEDHEGYLCSYDDMLRQIPMVCPSDNSAGKRQKSLHTQPTSFDECRILFLDGTNKGERLPTWNNWWLVVENEPFHDPSKQTGFEPDKWKGHFLLLRGDGSTSWPLLEQ